MRTACDELRVALIAATLDQGGAEKQLLYAARALKQAGVNVRIYSLNRGEFYEPALKSMGLTPLWVGRFKHPLLRLASLVTEIRRFKPHFVQSSHLFANLYAAVAGMFSGSISIGAIRSSLAYSRETNGFWTEWLVKAPRLLLTNSATTRNELSESGLLKMDRIFLVPNAIELSDFDNLPIKNDENEVVAIFIGRLIPIKRLNIFLRALALVRKSYPSFKGIVVGDGPERDFGERLALELNLGPSAVSFLGKRSDVRVLLSQADMLVLCSQDEGFPNVVLEAMAARLPVVTTPAGDAKFVVDNGVSGYVVPFDDVTEMAGKMYILANSPALRRQMGNAGRRRVEELYSFDCFANNLLSIYSKNAPESDCASSLERA